MAEQLLDFQKGILLYAVRYNEVKRRYMFYTGYTQGSGAVSEVN